MKFCFGDIVVVEENLIGVIVKCWQTDRNTFNYDIYVREFNSSQNYQEKDVERYMVRHKYLSEEELEWQKEARS